MTLPSFQNWYFLNRYLPKGKDSTRTLSEKYIPKASALDKTDQSSKEGSWWTFFLGNSNISSKHVNLKMEVDRFLTTYLLSIIKQRLIQTGLQQFNVKYELPVPSLPEFVIVYLIGRTISNSRL